MRSATGNRSKVIYFVLCNPKNKQIQCKLYIYKDPSLVALNKLRTKLICSRLKTLHNPYPWIFKVVLHFSV